jgi:hypothetical protein
MSLWPRAEEITVMGQVATALVVRSGQPVAHLSYIEAPNQEDLASLDMQTPAATDTFRD